LVSSGTLAEVAGQLRYMHIKYAFWSVKIFLFASFGVNLKEKFIFSNF